MKNIQKNTNLKWEKEVLNMAGKKVIDKQVKLDPVQYRKDHNELTFAHIAKKLRKFK